MAEATARAEAVAANAEPALRAIHMSRRGRERVDAWAQRTLQNINMTSGTAKATSLTCRPNNGSRNGTVIRQAKTAVVSERRVMGTVPSTRLGAICAKSSRPTARSAQPQRSQRGESIVSDDASLLQAQYTQ